MREIIERAWLGVPQHLYLAGVSVSPLISSVPGAILLAEHSDDCRLIACAVNVGGFGLAIGSLANLIALRVLRTRRAWLTFHAYSLPFKSGAASKRQSTMVRNQTLHLSLASDGDLRPAFMMLCALKNCKMNLWLALYFSVALLSNVVLAQDYVLESLKIDQPFARATPPGVLST